MATDPLDQAREALVHVEVRNWDEGYPTPRGCSPSCPGCKALAALEGVRVVSANTITLTEEEAEWLLERVRLGAGAQTTVLAKALALLRGGRPQ